MCFFSNCDLYKNISEFTCNVYEYFKILLVWHINGIYYCQPTKIAGRYRVDRSKISVSGMSSGAAMATQMHVAYSSIFMGVGVLAGGKQR